MRTLALERRLAGRSDLEQEIDGERSPGRERDGRWQATSVIQSAGT